MLITFEGPEGAGKSTAIAGVAQALVQDGRSVLTTREPGAGPLGAGIRRLLLDTQTEISPRSELFLFLADRAQHVATVVRPALAAGKIVLCDRFADSTVVYQGYGRGLDLPVLRDLNRFATDGLEPDLTLLFDLPPEVGIARLASKDRLDRESQEFHIRVRDGFLEEAGREPKRWRILDAARKPDEVLGEALRLIRAEM